MRDGVVETLDLLSPAQQMFIRFRKGLLSLRGRFDCLEEEDLLLAALAQIGS